MNWARATRSRQRGGVTIEFEYANGGTCPTKVTYTATAPNGEKLSKEFENSH